MALFIVTVNGQAYEAEAKTSVEAMVKIIDVHVEMAKKYAEEAGIELDIKSIVATAKVRVP